MNTFIWILQILMALIFLYSGFCKASLPADRLVAKGQTGVEGLPAAFIKFIGFSEMLGVLGLILPAALQIIPVLTPVTSLCFAFIMPFAGVIHYKRREYQNVLTNVVLFIIGILIAWYRF